MLLTKNWSTSSRGISLFLIFSRTSIMRQASAYRTSWVLGNASIQWGTNWQTHLRWLRSANCESSRSWPMRRFLVLVIRATKIRRMVTFLEVVSAKYLKYRMLIKSTIRMQCERALTTQWAWHTVNKCSHTDLVDPGVSVKKMMGLLCRAIIRSSVSNNSLS